MSGPTGTLTSSATAAGIVVRVRESLTPLNSVVWATASPATGLGNKLLSFLTGCREPRESIGQTVVVTPFPKRPTRMALGFVMCLLAATANTSGSRPAPRYPAERATCVNALAPKSVGLALERGYIPDGFVPQSLTWCSLRQVDEGAVEITERVTQNPRPVLESLPRQMPYLSSACPAVGSPLTAVLVSARDDSRIALALSTPCNTPNSTTPAQDVINALERAPWDSMRSYVVAS